MDTLILAKTIKTRTNKSNGSEAILQNRQIDGQKKYKIL